MKNKIGTTLNSIKTNRQIVEVLKKNKKFNLSYLTIYIGKNNNKSSIEFALLVNKTQFKLAVQRNKIKRQLRNILLTSEFKGGMKLLFKPNSLYLKKTFQEIKENIFKTIKKYQNGK